MVLRKSYLDKIIPFIDQDLIKVLVGIRRCGKTVHVKVCIAQKLAWLIILFDYCCFVRNELNRVLVSFLSNVLVRKIIL